MGRKSVWIKAEFSFCSPLFIHLFSTYCPHVFLIFLHFFFHIVWIIFIKYQYKYRNIFFYVFSLFLSIDVLSMWYCLPDSLSYFSCNPETASQVTLASLGTVFQTALTVLLRLRFLTVLARLRLSRHVQNLSLITRMRRICSSRIFSFGFICACRALGFSRIYLSLWTICGLFLL